MILLKHFFCPKVAFPSVERVGVERPHIFQRECAFDSCAQCAQFFRSNECIMSCPTAFSEDSHYKWREYGQVLLDNGKYLTELKEVSGGLQAFRRRFMQVLSKYKRHYYTYTFLNHVRKDEVANMGPDDVLINVDYAAQPTLDSQDKINCVGHGVCVMECFVVLHSPRDEFYVGENGQRVRYRFYECTHARVITPSTGKQKDQDWYMHVCSAEKLLRGLVLENPLRKNFSIWTDGARNQYKCRHNFMWMTHLSNELGIRITHRYGATAQFKGVHDKVGQVAKRTVRYV